MNDPVSVPDATQKRPIDLLVIGAGPTGLACAIEAQKAGLRAVLVDKGCICNSLFHYPANMTFFTTPELLEIGNMPFSSPNQKPTRTEALDLLVASLAACTIEGVRTNRDLLHAVALNPAFRNGEIETGFLAQRMAELLPS